MRHILQLAGIAMLWYIGQYVFDMIYFNRDMLHAELAELVFSIACVIMLNIDKHQVSD